MAIALPVDFSEFLKSLNDHRVDYLLVGGYAVSFHGYPRATEDIDVWVSRRKENATKVVAAIREFGFNTGNLREELFEEDHRIVRMGYPPLRIELTTHIDGVAFDECWSRRITAEFDGLQVPVICLADLKRNKRASGRHKDLDDLEKLP